ncbi:MAG TPA: hypothetical protein VG734_27275 [Lacunisphaera sp.]|nr:hypothetical protein [Lacunisphaera sp.]
MHRRAPGRFFSALSHPARLGLALGAAGLAQVPLHAEVVAVSSVVFNGYTRQREADKTYKPEYYTFGEGGCISRLVDDPAMARLTFEKIIRIVAPPLAQQNYRPALSTAQAQLLIIVYWGSTQGSKGEDPGESKDRAAEAIANFVRVKSADATAGVPQNSAEGAAYEDALWQLGLANTERDKLDYKNARILGYSDALERAQFAQHMSFNQDVLQELGDNRYFVVLQAYDFPTAVKARRLKPMWTVRLSVSEQGSFAEALDRMVWSATRYFGKDSGGLIRQQTKEGTVDLAPLKVLESVPESPAGNVPPRAERDERISK